MRKRIVLHSENNFLERSFEVVVVYGFIRSPLMRFGGYIGAQKFLIDLLVSCRQEFLLVCTCVLDFANTTKKFIRSTLAVESYYDTVATRDESSLVVVEKDLIGVSLFAELYMVEIQIQCHLLCTCH